MNQITITFASKLDLETARKQIDKARDYHARGGQLGVLGQALLLNTLVRAKAIETGDQKAELISASKGLLRETARPMNVKKDFSLMVYREATKRAIETLETNTKGKDE